MKHKTIQQLRDNLKKVLKRARPKQLKKLKKAYQGKRLKKWWCDYANADGYNTIAELKDFEGVGHRMKGGHRHNHVRNAMARRHKCKKGWRNCAVCGARFFSTHHNVFCSKYCAEL